MKRSLSVLSAAYAVMGILLAALLNQMFTPGILWFHHAAFGLLWLPAVMHFLVNRHSLPGFALAGSALTIAYLALENALLTPGLPWCLYACWPLVWWPILTAAGKKAGKVSFALTAGALITAYYVVLNIFLSPGHPWSVYIALALLWWPMTLHYAHTRRWIRFSVAGCLTIIGSMAVINAITSPGVIWAIYPAFTAIWWPMSLYISLRRRWLRYAVTASALIIAFFAVVNRIVSPGVVWAIYPTFAVLWWPMSLYFAHKRNWLGYAIAGSLLVIGFVAAINWLVSPGVIWAVYPAFAVLWWPLSVYYFHVQRRARAERQA